MGCGQSIQPPEQQQPDPSKPECPKSTPPDPSCALLLPPRLIPLYSDWKRLHGVPGGCQFARIEDDNGREVILAWTATAMDTGLKVFVKTYKTKYLPEAQREWHITSRHLQPPHPNVTGMLDYEEHGQVGFGIFRYHNCKDLFDHIADLYTRDGVRRGKIAYSEREVQSMIRQICIPLQWMHRKGVAHRDLKPENIMGGHVSRVRAITEKERKSSVDDRLLCIVDLGACGHCHTVEVEDQGSQKAHNQNLRLTDSAQLSAVAHGSFVPISEGFASPEQLVEAESMEEEEELWQPSLPFASDVYAVGGIMAMMILGTAQQYLTCAWTAEDAHRKLMKHLARSPTGRTMSAEGLDLLTKIVVPEADRPTIHEVLEHPWFKKDLKQPENLSKVWSDFGENSLKGTESAQYHAGDWIAFSTGADSDYVLSQSKFDACYLQSEHPIGQLTEMEKKNFPNWPIAQERGMSLFYRNPKCVQSFVQITDTMIDALHSRFPGHRAHYRCNTKFPNRPGTCRVSGDIPTNDEVVQFITERTCLQTQSGKLEFAAGAEWPVEQLLKTAVFAKKSAIPGTMSSTRALHHHTSKGSGRVKAFAFDAYEDAINIKMRFVVPGDYFKLSCHQADKGTAALQVSVVGETSIELNHYVKS